MLIKGTQPVGFHIGKITFCIKILSSCHVHDSFCIPHLKRKVTWAMLELNFLINLMNPLKNNNNNNPELFGISGIDYYMHLYFFHDYPLD